jgi:Flp pilus assembly protein TadD
LTVIRRERIEMAIALHRPLAPRRPVRSRAIETIDALLAAQPDEPDLLLLKGHLLDRLGEYEAARRV